ncbi:hypothetical protein CPB83DRAFT_841309 [Crepidotus variabilis]|uniref:Uncharacterized protein n=1 Tax=Crepidotus variabilis TaxID=179855 RepID=A0A9P6BD84_9AGAR|nr:hypothetical protein CPB83DRAFT_841309 [Crepidotus variabilis]
MAHSFKLFSAFRARRSDFLRSIRYVQNFEHHQFTQQSLGRTCVGELDLNFQINSKWTYPYWEHTSGIIMINDNCLSQSPASGSRESRHRPARIVSVKSSSLIQNIAFPQSGPKSRLHARRLRLKRHLDHLKLTTLRARATSAQAEIELEEMAVLTKVADAGLSPANLDPMRALQLAGAASRTLEARREMIQAKITEHKHALDSLEEEFLEVAVAVEQASSQYQSVTSMIHNLVVEPPPQNLME